MWRRRGSIVVIMAARLALGLAPEVYAQEDLTADEANQLFQQAHQLRTAGDYERALPLFERVAKAAPELWGEESTDYAVVLNDLGALYYDMSRYAKAKPLFERSLKIFEAKIGPAHSAVATRLNNLAALYEAMGQFTKADALYERSLKINEANFGPEHVNVALSLGHRAALSQAMGQYAKAEPLFQRSLRIYEDKRGRTTPTSPWPSTTWPSCIASWVSTRKQNRSSSAA